MSVTILARVQLRTDTSAAWAAENPVLLRGEGGYEWDTGRLRIGDGVTPFMSLPHQGAPFVGPVEPAGAAAGASWLDTSVSPAVLRQRSGDNTTWLRLSTPFPVPIDLGGTGATTAEAARWALGASPVGHAVFTAADAWAARWALGASPVGNAVFTAADAAAARTALGASPVGNAVFTAADAAAARTALGAHPLGVGQSWQDVTAWRTDGINYHNTSGRTIGVSVVSGPVNVNTSLWVGVTPGTMNMVTEFGSGAAHRISTCTAIVPNGHFYRHGGPVTRWMELR